MSDHLRDRITDIERLFDRLLSIQTELAILRTNFEHAPKRAAMEALEERLRKTVQEIVDSLRGGIADSNRTLRADMLDMLNSFRTEQRAQHWRWLRQGAIIIAVIVSLLTSGLNGALKAAQMTGLIPVF